MAHHRGYDLPVFSSAKGLVFVSIPKPTGDSPCVIGAGYGESREAAEEDAMRQIDAELPTGA